VAWSFLADPPFVPGLRFRGFQEESDYAVIAALINASCAADGVDRVETPDDVARYYAGLDNCDPFTDMVFAEIDGRPVGYGRVTWWQEHAGPRRYLPFCFLHPDGRGRGIGTAMLAHNEARLAQIASRHPDDRPKHLEVFHAESETAAAALYAAFGYRAVLHAADMVRGDLEDLPEAPLPEGLTVRTPRDDELRAVWEADQEAFEDHIGAAPGTENDYRRFLDFRWNDRSLWRVAWDGDRVAGQVRSYIDEQENAEFDRRRGYTEFISVRRPYRRRGLAGALLVQSLQAVRDKGMEEAALGVLTENLHGAFRLYEGVGFRVVRLWTTLQKPVG
jgi:ribosomal protein S18 acetylase RimI-like enzyme